MTDLSRLAGRIFGTPLLMDRARLDVMVGAIAPRFNLTPAVAPQAFSDDDERAQRVPEKQRKPYRVTAEGVAVVPVLGVLVSRAGQVTPDCTELRSYAAIERELTMALRDPQVRGVVLDIDSPGGEASLNMELSAAIAAMRGPKPIIAAVNAHAYSAAYAIASAADRIIVPQTGGVGSVGVVALHVDRSAEDQRLGHRYTYVAAGDRKLDGNPHAPLTDAAAAVMQAEVDRLYGIFTTLVATNRAGAGLSLAKVRGSQAGVFFGDNAVAAGFADAIGTFDDAVRLAAAGIAPTGRGRPSAKPINAGAKMEDDTKAGDTQATTTPPAPPAPPAQPDMAALTAAADARARANSQEIAALCELAGQPARAAAFITEGKTPAEARATLLAEKAEASKAGGEVSGHRPPAPPQNAANSNGVASMAGWDKAGRQVFGDKWKGF